MAKRKLSERQEMQKQTERALKVYKRDDMIQKARFTLSLQEQKCVLYAVSKIKPTDDVFQEYVFELKDFYALCGLKKESYTELKSILTGLKQKTWWVETAPGEESTVSWFNKVRTNKGSGKVTVRFDDDMMPYLLKLAEQRTYYTGYELQYVLPMASQYSPRLYEILKSYQKNNRAWFFELEELKKLLDCQNYDRFPDFRRRILEPAVEEINKYTDINIAYETEKEGRRIAKINFYMAAKKDDALLEAKKAGTEKLDGQIDLFEVLENSQDSVRAKFYRENFGK